MTVDPWAVLFFGVMALGLWCGWQLWQADATPIPRQNPRYVFRLVRREDRDAYVRIMRRTYAIQMRDWNRAMSRSMREIGRALEPAVRRLADALAALSDR